MIHSFVWYTYWNLRENRWRPGFFKVVQNYSVSAACDNLNSLRPELTKHTALPSLQNQWYFKNSIIYWNPPHTHTHQKFDDISVYFELRKGQQQFSAFPIPKRAVSATGWQQGTGAALTREGCSEVVQVLHTDSMRWCQVAERKSHFSVMASRISSVLMTLQSLSVTTKQSYTVGK